MIHDATGDCMSHDDWLSYMMMIIADGWLMIAILIDYGDGDALWLSWWL